MIRLVAIALLLLTALTIAHARTRVPRLPTYVCHRVETPVVLDGKLDEAAWRRADVFAGFRTYDNKKPSYRTEFRAIWDDRNLYLAFTVWDPDLVATMTKRDSGLYDEDCVEAFLSSGSDLSKYYEFEFSPHNVQMDASVHPNAAGTDKDVDYHWDCVALRTATRLEGAGKDQHWTIEIAMPFDQIGRDLRTPVLGEEWRANFYRIDYRAGKKGSEDLCWSPTLQPSFHTPERFGGVVFTK